MDTHQLQEKWAPVLDHGDHSPIKDSHRRQVTAQLLENQERAQSETAMLNEATPSTLLVQTVLRIPTVPLVWQVSIRS